MLSRSNIRQYVKYIELLFYWLKFNTLFYFFTSFTRFDTKNSLHVSFIFKHVWHETFHWCICTYILSLTIWTKTTNKVFTFFEIYNLWYFPLTYTYFQQSIKQDLIKTQAIKSLINAMTCFSDNIKLTKMIPFPFSPSSWREHL